MLAVSIIAHLSACSFVLSDEALAIARSQIRASIGALQSWEDIWPLGKRTLREVKTIAREVLFSQRSGDAATDSSPGEFFVDNTTSSIDPLAWASTLQDFGLVDMPWDLGATETLLSS
jgi:hypothetical protein